LIEDDDVSDWSPEMIIFNQGMLLMGSSLFLSNSVVKDVQMPLLQKYDVTISENCN